MTVNVSLLPEHQGSKVQQSMDGIKLLLQLGIMPLSGDKI